jgi:hypothetical protein
MKPFSRRGFISAGAISGPGVIAGVSACKSNLIVPEVKRSRSNPLDEITRENIKITDLKVTGRY